MNIVGKNIRFFRRSRNWTLSHLASKIDIKTSPLGRIERGLNLPSAKVLYNLSKVFNVPMDTLFTVNPCHAPIENPDNNNTYFVSITPRPQTPPKTLLRACNDIMAAFHALEDICQVQKHAYLPLSIPFSPNYDGMENLSIRIRQYFGTGDAVVFDYFELFENLGLRIILFPFTRGAKKMDAVSFYEPGFHNAFFFLNSRHNPEKQLFSLANELGKILISNQIRLSNTPLFTLHNEDLDNDRPINAARAARRFAATLLMPETAVRATVSQLGVTMQGWSWELLLRIKHRFGVSSQTFLYRLHELSLISDQLKDKFDSQIKEFYKTTGFKEPDSTRRCLTPNGRFFDLFITSQNIQQAKHELSEIEKIKNKYRIRKK